MQNIVCQFLVAINFGDREDTVLGRETGYIRADSPITIVRGGGDEMLNTDCLSSQAFSFVHGNASSFA